MWHIHMMDLSAVGMKEHCGAMENWAGTKRDPHAFLWWCMTGSNVICVLEMEQRTEYPSAKSTQVTLSDSSHRWCFSSIMIWARFPPIMHWQRNVCHNICTLPCIFDCIYAYISRRINKVSNSMEIIDCSLLLLCTNQTEFRYTNSNFVVNV